MNPKHKKFFNSLEKLCFKSRVIIGDGATFYVLSEDQNRNTQYEMDNHELGKKTTFAFSVKRTVHEDLISSEEAVRKENQEKRPNKKARKRKKR